MNHYIANKTFNEIEIGDSVTAQHTFTYRDLQLFAMISSDVNPIQLDQEIIKSEYFQKIVSHGMWGSSFIGIVLGMLLPGFGSTFITQDLKFLRPIHIGDTITAHIVVKDKNPKNKEITLECSCQNQDEKKVIIGKVRMVASSEKIRRKNFKFSEVEIREEECECPHYYRLLSLCERHVPLKTAVVNPIDRYSLEGAIYSAEAGLIDPILIGHKDKINQIAKEDNLKIADFSLISTTHSRDAAQKAIELVHQGKVEAIMKGQIHTDELMHEIVNPISGLKTERRMSHVTMADIPSFPRPLFITDDALNISPSLSDKKDIVQNAVDLFHRIGLGMPKVAILSAIETVNEKIPSTLDATALCKMAERMQITGAHLDGPLAFDNAISEEAARIKNIHSQVAGRADILVLPDLESGNILLKQLTLLSSALTAGVVMGAKVPIILTSRSSKPIERKASCALAVILTRGTSKKNEKHHHNA